MDTIELLMTILVGGMVSFVLFLLGYAGYSIVKRGKRKRLKEQLKYEKLEAEKTEWYLKNIDNELKQEIDNAVKEHNKKFATENFSKDKNNDDFSNELTEKVKDIISHKVLYLMGKAEEKYKKLNEKHNFDKNYENLNKMKELLQIGIDKLINNIKK